ncbi:hypothetical protein LZC95_19960 [Pendulispora brunnea]|uniref:Uncharacterized protein n=1 Tax=Pendulispora brunnea TaxID=2905690 RepID=A0ABZ2KNB8_9BACT
MPRFSCFAPFGMLDFSSRATHTESIYRSMVASLRDGIDQSPGSPDEAETYADAMSIARALYTLNRAENSTDPQRATELLPELERDYDVRPGPYDDLHARRTRLAALGRLPRGPTYVNVRAALAELLGDDFRAYLLVADGVTVPALDELPAVTRFQRGDAPPKFAQLIDPVTDLGIPLRVAYAPLEGLGGDTNFATGESILVSAEGTSQVERVTVSEPATGSFMATFRRAHDRGSLLTTMDFPAWCSTQRTALVVLAPRSAYDPERRRQVHELLRRMVRGVSTWAIVAPSSVTETEAVVGPWRLPAMLGATVLGVRQVSLFP